MRRDRRPRPSARCGTSTATPGHGGGYVQAIGLDGAPSDTTKAAYGHAHVLLAAAAGRAAGHELAVPLFDDALAVIDEHFWHEEEGASVEDHDRDWRRAGGLPRRQLQHAPVRGAARGG